MKNLLQYIENKSAVNGKSYREWKAFGSVEQSAYHAGATNVCLEILDFVSRNPDCLKEEKVLVDKSNKTD